MTQTQTHPTAKRIDRTERANLHPADGMTVISIPDESPPAEWPNEEREWLRQLLADHDRVDRNIPDLDIANVLEDAMTEGER